MNPIALFTIVIAALGLVKAQHLEAVHSATDNVVCAQNDGACVARVITKAKDAVKQAKKAAKKLCALRRRKRK